jgi:outer membrane protein insertion porin family
MKPDRHLRMMILSLCAFLLFVASFAQSNVTIEKVEVRGNHRIPQDTIFYYIMSRAGDVYDQDKLLQDFRALYKTNLFKDVKVDVADGDTGKIITFIVEEKPIIRSLDYEGIKSFKKSDILDKFSEEKLGLTIDSPFEPTKIKKAEKIIQNLLVLNGRPLGTVETVVTDIPPNAVSIVFKVTEGEKVRIGKIEFTGNKVFDSGKLKKTLKLDKERGLISMLPPRQALVRYRRKRQDPLPTVRLSGHEVWRTGCPDRGGTAGLHPAVPQDQETVLHHHPRGGGTAIPGELRRV